MRKGPPEELVQRLWRARGTGRWSTTSGQEVEVGYPGRRLGGAGPDFQGALLRSGIGPKRTSQVEVHVCSSGWRVHGHQRDPAYDQVGLQVVVWEDTRQPCRLASGEGVPQVVLGPAMGKGTLGQLAPGEPCRGAGLRREPGSLASILEAAGLERLRERARTSGEAVVARGPDQALYEGIMETLGYSQNRAPFRRLARSLPFSSLREWQAGLERALPTTELAAAFYFRLLAASGLEAGALGPAPTLAPGEWTTVGVRPANHPRHRLKAAGALLACHLEGGFVAGLQPHLDRGPASLEAALSVEGEAGQPAPLGRDRARQAIINAVLPAFYALGQLQGTPQLTARAIQLYATYPAPGEDRVTRLVTSQVWGQPVHLPRACYQQGCHYIFQRYCQPRDCGRCPLAC